MKKNRGIVLVALMLFCSLRIGASETQKKKIQNLISGIDFPTISPTHNLDEQATKIKKLKAQLQKTSLNSDQDTMRDFLTENKKNKTIKPLALGWWDKLKSYISYVPVYRPLAYTFGGAKTVGRTVANFSSDPLVRFRGNLNIIQKEYYGKDLKKAVRQLRIELKKLIAKEGPGLKRFNKDAVNAYGSQRANNLLTFVQGLEDSIVTFDKKMQKGLKEENNQRKQYEQDNAKEPEEDEDDVAEDFEEEPDFEGDDEDEVKGQNIKKGKKKIEKEKSGQEGSDDEESDEE